MSTQSRVLEIVAQTLEFPVEEIRASDAFLDDLGASSLDVVNLIWRIEEAFGLGETPDPALEGIDTVQDLVDLVEGLRAGMSTVESEGEEVVLASDHAGLELKTALIHYLRAGGFETRDLGPSKGASVDYPDFAARVAAAVSAGEARAGVLICGSGIGMSIAANRHEGIRAALVCDPLMARLARQHNDANVLCLGARLIGPAMAEACVDAFLSAEFEPGEDGRHARRVRRIEAARTT